MSRVRALAGTRKGAFIPSADGKRDKWISGPHFAGWEITTSKGSPPIQTGSMRRKQAWFGQVLRLERRRQDVETVGNNFA